MLVDVDLGMKRTGVATAEAAVELARLVSTTPGLRFDGLMGYEGHTLMIPDPAEKRAAIATAIGRLLQARDAVSRPPGCNAGSSRPAAPAPISTPPTFPGITEIQAGGGIFACQYYTQVCHVKGHRPASPLLATVVSRPAPDRAILDIGQKSVSQHQTPPVLRDYPDCRVIGLSAEHADDRSSIRNTRCESEKRCTSFPVIAILLLYSTIGCWGFVRSGCRPFGISWARPVAIGWRSSLRILLVDNHFGHEFGYSRIGPGHRIAWMLLLQSGVLICSRTPVAIRLSCQFRTDRVTASYC